jgi:hypothetical protein
VSRFAYGDEDLPRLSRLEIVSLTTETADWALATVALAMVEAELGHPSSKSLTRMSEVCTAAWARLRRLSRWCQRPVDNRADRRGRSPTLQQASLDRGTVRLSRSQRCSNLRDMWEGRMHLDSVAGVYEGMQNPTKEPEEHPRRFRRCLRILGTGILCKARAKSCLRQYSGRTGGDPSALTASSERTYFSKALVGPRLSTCWWKNWR